MWATSSLENRRGSISVTERDPPARTSRTGIPMDSERRSYVAMSSSEW